MFREIREIRNCSLQSYNILKPSAFTTKHGPLGCMIFENLDDFLQIFPKDQNSSDILGFLCLGHF